MMEWSADGQVFYCDDKAWGITPNLRTVVLGKKEDIIKKHPVARRASRTPPRRTRKVIQPFFG